MEAALAGVGIVYLFEDGLRPHLDSGALQALLEDGWQPFSGPFLYYPGRRRPAPLRAFVDFVKAQVPGWHGYGRGVRWRGGVLLPGGERQKTSEAPLKFF